MKKLQLLFISTLLALFVSGCLITSLNPIYKKEDLVTNPQILGDWLGGKTIWTFKKGEDKSYILSYKECNDPINDPDNYSSCTLAEFKVHLIMLENEYYINFFPIEYMNTENTFIRAHVKSLHSFAKLYVDEEKLKISLFNTQWFEDLIADKPEEIAFSENEEGIVITASTEDLQKFIVKYSKYEEAFVESSELKRYTVKEN